MMFIMLQKSWGKHLIFDEFEPSFTMEAGQNGVFSSKFTFQHQKSTSNAIFMTFFNFHQIKTKLTSRFRAAVSPTFVIFSQLFDF